MRISNSMHLKDPEMIALWRRLLEHASSVRSDKAAYYENSIDTEWQIHARRGSRLQSSFVFFTKIATSDFERLENVRWGQKAEIVKTVYKISLVTPFILRRVSSVDLNSDEDNRIRLFSVANFRNVIAAHRSAIFQADTEEISHLIRFIEQSDIEYA